MADIGPRGSGRIQSGSGMFLRTWGLQEKTSREMDRYQASLPGHLHLDFVLRGI
jgi:hypothetical protein